MTPTCPTPLDLATCVEHSLHLSLDRFDLSAARLYGITIVDPKGIASNVDGSLRITARDATWQQEIRRARSLILERLNELLGAGTVRRLVID